MDKIRKSLKSLNSAIVFITILLIGFVLIYFFHIDPTIVTILCIVIPLGICYIIDELADKEILERIHYEQTAFNKEFNDFKLIYGHRLNTLPFLYAEIDKVQNYIIKFCESYPEKYKEGKDFKKVTAQLIIAQLNGFIEANHNMYKDCDKVQEFIDEIKRKEKLP